MPEIDTMALAFPVGGSWAGLTGGRIDTSARTLTIELSNTSPSPPSLLTAGRVTHAVQKPSRFALLKGIEIVVEAPFWVTTDGELGLMMVFRLPPSGTGEGPVYYLISELNMDPRDVTFLPPRIGTISRENVVSFIYTAPHSIAHASLPVKIRARARVTHGAGYPFGLYKAHKYLHVVRRTWAVKAEYKSDTGLCGTEKSYVFSYADVRIQTFHLDYNLELIADPPADKARADKRALTSCGCAATWQEEPKPITFTGAGGRLVTYDLNGRPAPAYFLLEGTAEFLIPGIDLVCGGKKFAEAPVPFPIVFLTLLGQIPGGLRPSDRTQRYAPIEKPVLTLIMKWYSIAE